MQALPAGHPGEACAFHHSPCAAPILPGAWSPSKWPGVGLRTGEVAGLAEAPGGADMQVAITTAAQRFLMGTQARAAVVAQA